MGRGRETQGWLGWSCRRQEEGESSWERDERGSKDKEETRKGMENGWKGKEDGHIK